MAGFILELIHNCLANNLNIVKNYGISFGINGMFFIILNVLFVLLITVIFIRLDFWSLGFLVIGGWVNFIDRIRFGYVRDYWQFGMVYNNLADWMIGLGIILFLINLYGKKNTNNF